MSEQKLEFTPEWVQRTRTLRVQAIDQLEALLLRFDRNATAAGMQVRWVLDVPEAVKELLFLCKEHDIERVFAGSGEVLDELQLGDILRQNGLSYQEISTEKGNCDGDPEATPAEGQGNGRMANAAWMGGADFLVAGTGTVVVRGRTSQTYHNGGPHRIRVFWAGLEQVTQSIADLSYWWPAWEAGQQPDTNGGGAAGLTLVQGPMQGKDAHSPESVYVFIVDNGRTALLEDVRMRELLYCISCGRCDGVCPTGQPNMGPREGLKAGIVAGTPAEAGSFPCTRCGACSAVCPVGIPLHRLMADKQAALAAQKEADAETKAWQAWRKAMLGEGWLGMFGVDQKAQSILRCQMPGPADLWKPAEKSFSRRWAMGQKKN